jgi:hypothetical protein
LDEGPSADVAIAGWGDAVGKLSFQIFQFFLRVQALDQRVRGVAQTEVEIARSQLAALTSISCVRLMKFDAGIFSNYFGVALTCAAGSSEP